MSATLDTFELHTHTHLNHEHYSLHTPLSDNSHAINSHTSPPIISPLLNLNSAIAESPSDLFTPFDLTVDIPLLPRQFPKSLKIAVWNCRGGIESKLNELKTLFLLSNCDILILNETFRRPGVPWPSYFPPLLAESTDHSISVTRCPAGVAVVANPSRIRNIKSFSLLEPPSDDGTKVCLKINNLTLLAIYIPPSSPQILLRYVQQAHNLSSANNPIVICGDMNAHSRQLGSATPNSAGSHIDELVRPRGSSSFFLADTGPAFTRPSPRGSGGSIIDLVFGANSNLSGGHCYDGVDWTSDHRPISCTVSPQSPRSDDSTNYLRIRLEELDVPETRSAYVSAIQLAQPALDDRIRAMAFCASPTSTVTEKLALVDAMELDFTSTVLSIAKTVLGTKRVPVLPSGTQSRPSPEYIQAFSELQSVYQALRQRPQLAEPLLTERDRLKIKVRSIALRDRTRAYRDWLQNTGSLSAVQVMKIV